MRWLLFFHRYAGVAIGLLMTLWCVSGVVMLYVAYPDFDRSERLRGLAPIDLRHCCDIGAHFADNQLLAGFHIEMLPSGPVLRLAPLPGDAKGRSAPANVIDLRTGTLAGPFGSDEIAAIVRGHAAQSGIVGNIGQPVRIEKDQWTVQHFRRHQPLYKVDLGDPRATSFYVWGTSGEIVQDTTRQERFWNWLGAIPHWLYPTLLRQNPPLWTQVLIWTSLLGTCLTLTGLYAGLARIGRRPGKVSPYRGLWAWHHTTGLIAGLFTLGWVASGLFSMNPWGLFESRALETQQLRINGTVRWGEVRQVAARLGTVQLPPGTVRVEAAPLADTLYLLAIDRNGTAVRLAADGTPAPLHEAEVRRALERAGAAVDSLVRLQSGDGYHYDVGKDRSSPAFRAILGDRGRTRLYLDPTSGTVIAAADRPARAYRWLHHALHRFDFEPLRHSNMRLAVILPLLAAVTLVCATGCRMGFKRVRTDARRWCRRRRRRALR